MHAHMAHEEDGPKPLIRSSTLFVITGVRCKYMHMKRLGVLGPKPLIRSSTLSDTACAQAHMPLFAQGMHELMTDTPKKQSQENRTRHPHAQSSGCAAVIFMPSLSTAGLKRQLI